jgi:hypothetical protein
MSQWYKDGRTSVNHREYQAAASHMVYFDVKWIMVWGLLNSHWCRACCCLSTAMHGWSFLSDSYVARDWPVLSAVYITLSVQKDSLM